MDWNATDGRYHEALRRLAVVLLVLAGLAERAAGRPWPVRWFVLTLLCRAESLACGCAVQIGADALPLTVGYPPCLAGERGEAARLAQTFRALATGFFALARKAPQWLRTARRHDPVRVAGDRRTALRDSWFDFEHRGRYADTS